MDAASLTTLIYDIDDSDRLVAVNDTWTSFAVVNDAPELSAPGVLGLRLWDAITDPSTRELYRTLLDRVRHGEVIDYTYRCDGPAVRRDMSMHVALEGRRVRFTSRIQDATPRASEAILDRLVPRTDELLRVCGWCKKIAVADDRWEEVEVAIPLLGLKAAHTLPALTHGICPGCYDRVSAEFAA
jgi:hypothetical protein